MEFFYYMLPQKARVQTDWPKWESLGHYKSWARL